MLRGSIGDGPAFTMLADARILNAVPDDRIDGWKAIAAYFGRDRTTAIRWARERSLPVHRLPGGKTATVYALRHELAQWATGLTDVKSTAAPLSSANAEAAPIASPMMVSPKPTRRRKHRLWAAAAAAALIAMTTGLSQVSPVDARRTSAAEYPASAVLRERFLLARDLVGNRTSADIEKAIGLLVTITLSEPAYASAHASLAEALILSREFGVRTDKEAFAAARASVRAAIRLDPDNATGHRALGFIAYWADHDRARADKAFQRAIALAPQDAMTHFWYGNVLSDQGRNEMAMRALDKARLLQPGSVAIQTDYAWARWAAGDEDNAAAALSEIIKRHPDFAVAHDCMSIVLLARADYAGYIRHLTQFAALRNDAEAIAHAHTIAEARRNGGDAAAHNVMMKKALADVVRDPKQTTSWATFLATVASDRAQVATLLVGAEQRGEIWGDAGMVLHMRSAWNKDDWVMQALARRTEGAGVS